MVVGLSAISSAAGLHTCRRGACRRKVLPVRCARRGASGCRRSPRARTRAACAASCAASPAHVIQICAYQAQMGACFVRLSSTIVSMHGQHMRFTRHGKTFMSARYMPPASGMLTSIAQSAHERSRTCSLHIRRDRHTDAAAVQRCMQQSCQQRPLQP